MHLHPADRRPWPRLETPARRGAACIQRNHFEREPICRIWQLRSAGAVALFPRCQAALWDGQIHYHDPCIAMSRPCQPSRCPATVWPSRDGRSFRWRSLCRLYGFGRFAALCRPLLSSSPRTQRQRADCWLGGLDKARYSTLLSQFNCRLFLPVSRQSHTSCLRLSPLQASRSYMDSALPQILYPGLSTRLTHRTVWGFGSRASDSLHSSTPTPALSLTLALTPTQHGSPSRSRSRSRPL
jgi:hypothetical protein